MNKVPKVLYHGSKCKNLKILYPKVSELNKSKIVFAGEKWAALAFIGKWTDSDIIMGLHNNKPYLE